MDLDRAIYSHAEWRFRFRTAILRREPLDLATVASPTECSLGQWFLTEQQGPRAELESFSNLVELHAEFHRAAAKVVELMVVGDFVGAEAQLEYGSPYFQASQAMAGALMSLKQDPAP